MEAMVVVVVLLVLMHSIAVVVVAKVGMVQGVLVVARRKGCEQGRGEGSTAGRGRKALGSTHGPTHPFQSTAQILACHQRTPIMTPQRAPKSRVWGLARGCEATQG